MGEFITLPERPVIFEEADGTQHMRADGKGPACPSWKFPVHATWRDYGKAVTLQIDDWQQLVEFIKDC